MRAAGRSRRRWIETTVVSVAWVAWMMPGWAVAAQAPPDAPASRLRAAVDAYLAEPDDARAAAALDAILSRAVDPQALARALTAPPAAPRFPMRFTIPHRGRSIVVAVDAPAGHDGAATPLPVVQQIFLGRIPDPVRVKGVINCRVRGYDPRRYSEDGRDLFTKVSRAVAWRANGDPARLWLAGFSWGAHAAFDVALHRPGVVRGLLPMAGAPRRTHFRLLPNLRGLEIFVGVGAGDDRELIWNLREVGRRGDAHGFGYELIVDPRVKGRFVPSMRALQRLSGVVTKAGAARPTALNGRLVADGPRVESDWIRIDEVVASRVRVPNRIAVPARLSPDQKRLRTIAKMAKKVAWLEWTREGAGDSTRIRLERSGVRRATVFIRDPTLVGRRLRLRAGRTRIDRVVEPDPAVMLREARRRGDRQTVTWAAFAVQF